MISMQSAVSIANLRIAYEGHTVIDRMSLDVAPREFLVMLGPSGCGKSTLLNAIAGLQDIAAGEISISGRNVTWDEPKDRGIGMVFQSYALYPHMSVRRNLSFGLRVTGIAKAEIETRVARAAKLLHLEALLDRKPGELSGGQRQRVAIGRALVREVDVFLFDEPLSNLDAKLRNELRVEIKRLHQQLGNTMIYVTHDQVEAMTLGTRIAVFNRGIVEQMGRPLDLYERPNKQFVASFLGSPTMNFLPCSATSATSGTQVDLGGGNCIAIPGEMTSGESGPFQLGIRPEHIEVVPAGQGLAAHVEFVEHLGDHQVVHSTLLHNRQRVVAKIPMSTRVDDSAELVGLRLDSRWCRLFSEDGRVVAAAL